MRMRRREALAGGIALAASACTTPAVRAAAASDPSLKEVAARTGRRFGSAVGWGAPGADRGSFANPAYAAILEREAVLLVPEN
jgi:endo-1,4-beta-xylanase